MNITYPIFQKASFYLEKYGRETFLADAGQRSRAIIPGDDPGDQQPPERRPESDASIDNFSWRRDARAARRRTARMTIKLPPGCASGGEAVLSPGADPRANRETEPSSTIARRRSALSLEGRRLRKLTDGELADEVGTFEARIDALKAEAIRREIRRAEGEDFRITLTPPGTSQRTDKPLLLQVMGITEAEYTARFCHPVQTGWRLTCTARRKFETAA